MALTLLCLAMVLAPVASATPWTMPRGDPQGTGAIDDAGPEWPDVALNLTLPGYPSDAPPLILDGTIYAAHEVTRDAPTGSAGVVAIDVDTGQMTQVIELEHQPDTDTEVAIATDGDRLYVTGYRIVQAYPLDGGDPLWTWRWDPLEEDPVEAQCRYMAVDEDGLTVACEEQRETSTQEDERTLVGLTSFAARLDKATGALQWDWVRESTTLAEDQLGQEIGQEAGRPVQFTWPVGLAVTGPVVLVQTMETSGGDIEPFVATMEGGQGRTVIRALDRASGDVLWSQQSDTATWGSSTADDGTPLPEAARALLFGDPAASGSAVYAKLGVIAALNPGTGEVLWERSLGAEDFAPGTTAGTGVSVAGKMLFTTSAQTVYRIDSTRPDARWATTLDPSKGERFDEDPIVGTHRVYTAAATDEGAGTVYAFDRATGDIAWAWSSPEVISFSMGEGLIAVTTSQGDRLVLLGQTGASPVASVDVSEAYPARGETVTVDLSGSQAGLQGPVTRYKAIWGDGTQTPWQATPVVTHAYNATGETTARFLVANDAGQSASTVQVFDVGGTEPTLLEQAFERDNQDMTFGLLGIALALGGGVVSVARRYRERSRLQEELEALETGFEDTRSNPGECEAFLETRKGRARSLMLDGDLTEEQFGVIETRVAELRRELRTAILDDRLEFLPHGMVQTLKRMLADGRISAWERDAMEEILENDQVLSPAHKDRVRALLDQWFTGDTDGLD